MSMCTNSTTDSNQCIHGYSDGLLKQTPPSRSVPLKIQEVVWLQTFWTEVIWTKEHKYCSSTAVGQTSTKNQQFWQRNRFCFSIGLLSWIEQLLMSKCSSFFGRNKLRALNSLQKLTLFMDLPHIKALRKNANETHFLTKVDGWRQKRHFDIYVCWKIKICCFQSVSCRPHLYVQPQPLLSCRKSSIENIVQKPKCTSCVCLLLQFWHACLYLHNDSSYRGIQMKIRTLAWNEKHSPRAKWRHKSH